MTLSQFLQASREKSAAATKGQWHYRSTEMRLDPNGYDMVLDSIGDEVCYSTIVGEEQEYNARFIAHARNNWDALLNVIEKLDAALELYEKLSVRYDCPQNTAHLKPGDFVKIECGDVAIRVRAEVAKLVGEIK